MKKTILLAAFSLVIITVHAKIWRVNNVPGVAADFTTAQAAHDGAAANDTIYLESSPNSYGDVTTTKKLTWMGLGYFLPQNTGLQFHSNTGFVSSLTVNSGSEGSIYQIPVNSGIAVNSVANVTFQRCYIGSSFHAGGTSNHVTITQCYFNFNNYLIIDPSIAESSFTITNNMGYTNYIAIRQNAYQVTFNNNTLFPGQQDFIIDNATISNNIFYNSAYRSLFDAGYPSNVTNNLWVGTTNSNFVGTNNNIFNASNTTVFAGGSSPDGQYKLAAGSPAIGTGAGNVDMGAYGSANPYVVSLIPAIPSIYQLSVPANATGNTLPSTVSTRANN